jgi:hypothetical protein
LEEAGGFPPVSFETSLGLTTSNGTPTITAVPLNTTAKNQIIILGGTVAPSATYSGFVLEGRRKPPFAPPALFFF